MAGIAAKLSPAVEDAIKERALQKRIKLLDTQINTAYEGKNGEGEQKYFLQAKDENWTPEQMKEAYESRPKTKTEMTEDIERNKQLEALGEEKKEALLSSSKPKTIQRGYEYAGKLAIYGERNRMARNMIEKQMREKANEGLKARLENQMDEKTWMRVYRETMGGSNG